MFLALKKFLKLCLDTTKPFVWKLARAYNIKIEIPGTHYGVHPLIIEGGQDQIDKCIPSSVYFNTGSGRITVGLGTAFGYDVKVIAGKHLNIQESKWAKVEFHQVPKSGDDILIGKNCFIGTGAIILGPVIIGDFTVVAPGSVVNKNLDPMSYYAGVPAKKINNL